MSGCELHAAEGGERRRMSMRGVRSWAAHPKHQNKPPLTTHARALPPHPPIYGPQQTHPAELLIGWS